MKNVSSQNVVMPLDRRVPARLADLDTRGLLRRLRPPAGIDLSSNDYLGLATHPLLKERMADAVLREGCGSTGSRLLTGDRESFSAVERRFAKFKGAERSLYFSSGYLANLGVLTTFPDAGDTVFSDELNHASLIDGIRLSRARHIIFYHNDVDALGQLIKKDAGQGQKFVVVESLFSMDGDLAPLAAYAALCKETGAALIVDEAHAVGIYGEHGSGLIESTGVGKDVFVSINTAGKALGVSGAFVAGPVWSIDYLIQRARSFAFSTAPPPSLATALEASLTVIVTEPERRNQLRASARYLRDQLKRARITVPDGDSQIISVVVGENHAAVALAMALQDKGFDVRAIRPPSVPAGTARLRVSVNAKVSKPMLDSFVIALKHGLRETMPCSVASS